jgi:hypothetical protein
MYKMKLKILQEIAEGLLLNTFMKKNILNIKQWGKEQIDLSNNNLQLQDWGHTLSGRALPSKLKALGSIPSTAKKNFTITEID